MADRRRIFVSAVTRELGSFRQAIVRPLEEKGWHVVIQERLPLDAREVTPMLRDAISPCDAVLCLVGSCYGAEPETGRQTRRGGRTRKWNTTWARCCVSRCSCS